MKSRVWLLATMVVLAGCRGRPAASPSSAGNHPAISVVQVSEPELGVAIERLIVDEEIDNRAGWLVGVVDCQLRRARRLLDEGQEQAGLAALEGAFFLVGGGEFRSEMIRHHAELLLDAANAAAHSGNEGRASVLYAMLDQMPAPISLRDEVQGHLQALVQWRQVVLERGGLQALGARQRASAPLELYWPTEDNYRAARSATLRWMDAARRFEPERRPPPQSYEELDEREEADRARQTGVQALAVLALRHGDLQGLLRTLEDPSVAPSVRPKFAELLTQAIEDSEPDAWAELLDGVDSLASERSEMGELARAASFRVALSLLRADPQAVRSLVPMSGLLIAHGMPDVVPVLFARQLKRQSDPRVLALALRLTSQALIGLEGIGDLTTARLTFANAKPLLERAVNGADDAKSSLAMLEHVMGAMEVRAAELALARPHLAAAVRLEPSFEALRLLAAVDRQQNRRKEALESLARMAKMSTGNGLALAETQLLHFEVERDQNGASVEATQALEQALRGALKARAESSAAPGNLAGAERLLGRALEHYGQVAAARRAGIRSIEASRNDPDQLVTTVLDLARRALTLSDVEGSREALRVALEEKLEPEDLAYVAVWRALLERQQPRPALGAAREALLRAARGKGWPATVASWALGKLSDDQLRQAATRRTEQVEAVFYIALSARVRGETSAALEGLRQVANSEALELVEVTVARDLLHQQSRIARPALPGSVELP
jgi:hypothetical protein